MIAVTIGIPIATIVPNVRVRMIIAATIPITSLDSVSAGDSSVPIGPPAATCMPAFTPGSRRVEHALRLLVRQVGGGDVEQDGDEGGLLVLRELRRALPGRTGSTARATYGIFSIAL